MAASSMVVKLRYDGKFDFIQPDGRQWTIMSHHIGPDGSDYFKSSRIGPDSLRELGILPKLKETHDHER